MKKKCKFLIIPFLVIFLLVNSICIFSFADVVEGETSVGGPQEFMTDYGESTSYLWYKYIESENDYKRVYAFVYTALPDDIEYTESGGIISFTTTNKSRQRGYEYIFNSGNYGRKYTSQPSIYNFSVNVEEKVVNGRDCEDVILCIDGHLYDPNALNVEVSFSPALVGEVDRSLSNGTNSALMNQLVMSVQNNSRFAIQYEMYIEKHNKTTHRVSSLDKDVYYDDDSIYIYYSNEWIYTIPYDTPNDIWSTDVSKQQKPTQWHYVSANSPDVVIIDFDQINLKEGEEYDVIVKAIRCDFGCSSEYFSDTNNDDRIYPELKMLDNMAIQTVYSSTFSMMQYNDVKYNPDSSANGVLPYDGRSGISQKGKYKMMRNALENSDGSIDYTNKNVYDDPNSWYNNPDSYNQGHSYDDSENTPDSSYTGVLSKITGVYSFFGACLSYFPADIFKVINIALWSSLIILIFRRLH